VSRFQTRKFRRFGFSLWVVFERHTLQQLWLNDTSYSIWRSDYEMPSHGQDGIAFSPLHRPRAPQYTTQRHRQTDRRSYGQKWYSCLLCGLQLYRAPCQCSIYRSAVFNQFYDDIFILRVCPKLRRTAHTRKHPQSITR